METARLVLKLFFVFLALFVPVFIISFDIWAWHTIGRQATVSAIVAQWARDWPVLPMSVGLLIGIGAGLVLGLGIGLLLGHLFW